MKDDEDRHSVADSGVGSQTGEVRNISYCITVTLSASKKCAESYRSTLRNLCFKSYRAKRQFTKEISMSNAEFTKFI